MSDEDLINAQDWQFLEQEIEQFYDQIGNCDPRTGSCLTNQALDFVAFTRKILKALQREVAANDRLVNTITRHNTNQAVFDVVAERQRQINGEGWTIANDDKHNKGEMARAAACYALHAARQGFWSKEPYQSGDPEYDSNCDTLWPWGFDWWKPKNPRRDLIRAAALLIAEIERIDRQEASK